MPFNDLLIHRVNTYDPDMDSNRDEYNNPTLKLKSVSGKTTLKCRLSQQISKQEGFSQSEVELIEETPVSLFIGSDWNPANSNYVLGISTAKTPNYNPEGEIITFSFNTDSGTGYTNVGTETFEFEQISGEGSSLQTFVVAVTIVSGSVSGLTFSNYGQGYEVGDEWRIIQKDADDEVIAQNAKFTINSVNTLKAHYEDEEFYLIKNLNVKYGKDAIHHYELMIVPSSLFTVSDITQ